MLEVYEQMLINYVWYIAFVRVEGGAKLLRYYRRHYKSLYKPTAVGAGYPVESDDGKRTIVAVEFIPYGKTEKERLEVVNPSTYSRTTWTETNERERRGGLVPVYTVYMMDADTYWKLFHLQRRLHNAQRAMTFDEQRDFAETWRLAMEEIEKQDKQVS